MAMDRSSIVLMLRLVAGITIPPGLLCSGRCERVSNNPRYYSGNGRRLCNLGKRGKVMCGMRSGILILWIELSAMHAGIISSFRQSFRALSRLSSIPLWSGYHGAARRTRKSALTTTLPMMTQKAERRW